MLQRVQVLRRGAQRNVGRRRGGPAGGERTAAPPQQVPPDVLTRVRADRRQQQRGHLV